MPFIIVRNDITKMETDAIVNAANAELMMGGGVCGAIFKAAGEKELQECCNKLSPIKVGGAVMTPGFKLKAKHIIHAAGPIYSHWSEEQNEKYLRSAYTESLKLAKENNCKSIAFPLISSGIYGYPKDKALKIATDAVKSFLENNEMTVFLTVFDRESFQISGELLGSVHSYIDENYVEENEVKRRSRFEKNLVENGKMCFLSPAEQYPVQKGDYFANLDEPFSDILLKIIDNKGKTDVEVYKKANIDRKLFSKIRSAKGYMPSKRTIIALAIALELDIEETNDLLKCGGYALSHSQKFDLIVEYFIKTGKYDVFEINEILFKYDQQLLGN